MTVVAAAFCSNKGLFKTMKRLAIIAGKGHLPLDVAETATADGYDVLVLPIDGQADADFTCYQSISIRLGSIGKTRSIIVQHGIDQLVMVGKVTWPSISGLSPDSDGVKLLGKMITKGDDTVLRFITAYFMEKGIETIAPDRFLPGRKMPLGVIHDATSTDQGTISPEGDGAIACGVAILAALGTRELLEKVMELALLG